MKRRDFLKTGAVAAGLAGSLKFLPSLKAAESDLNQDVDLSAVMVKPEDTAGVPSGWGKKAGG